MKSIKFRAEGGWWVYQLNKVYLRDLHLREITKEQYDKDLDYLNMLVEKTIKEGERFTFTEFMDRIFN